ncbi:MAG: hypothetical protein DI529_12360 [Chryseobacterium sp.]|nr:MAG: hypothetical protein DI529_12360 [Chryseobacterium sp.]
MILNTLQKTRKTCSFLLNSSFTPCTAEKKLSLKVFLDNSILKTHNKLGSLKTNETFLSKCYNFK